MIARQSVRRYWKGVRMDEAKTVEFQGKRSTLPRNGWIVTRSYLRVAVQLTLVVDERSIMALDGLSVAREDDLVKPKLDIQDSATQRVGAASGCPTEQR